MCPQSREDYFLLVNYKLLYVRKLSFAKKFKIKIFSSCLQTGYEHGKVQHHEGSVGLPAVPEQPVEELEDVIGAGGGVFNILGSVCSLPGLVCTLSKESLSLFISFIQDDSGPPNCCSGIVKPHHNLNSTAILFSCKWV